MKTKGKKMNTYARYTLITAGTVCFGAVLGGLILLFDMENWGSGIGGILQAVRDNLFPILSVLTVVFAAYGEFILGRMRALGSRILCASDEEGDCLECDIEVIGACGTVASAVFNAGTILILSTGYSLDYIESIDKAGNLRLLAAFLVFIAGCIYAGFWQVRFVKTVQKSHPEKKGDPTTRKFQKQWLESCDEAEREMIYQSAYKTYLAVSKIYPSLALVTMLAHLVWDTGITAIAVVAFLWIYTTAVYCRSCATKKIEKLR